MRSLVRWLLPAAALAAAAASGVFAFTNIAWKLLGSPEETYPEILFFAIGFPHAVVALLGGVLGAVTPADTRSRLKLAFNTTAVLALIASGFVAAAVFAPQAVRAWIPPTVLQVVFTAWPAFLLVLIIAGGVAFWGRGKEAA